MIYEGIELRSLTSISGSLECVCLLADYRERL